MFFLKELSHTIQLHPSYFGPDLRSYIKNKLHSDIEGKCTGSGKILSGTGLAEFDVKYNAVVLKPFKGEVLDAVVTSVNVQGFFASVGPLNIFVSQLNIPPYLKFDSTTLTPSFRSNDVMLQKDMNVRIKLISCRMDASNIIALGSIQDDFLGVVAP